MTFTREPPPGFNDFDEHKPVRVYRRHLPHWRQTGATYFATFHLADAMPAGKQHELKAMRREWEIKNPNPRDATMWLDYARQVFRKVEKWLDSGFGSCWFGNDKYARELARSILHFHNVRYEIGCFVIMSNHCHLTIRPYDEFELEKELGAIKRATSRFVNQFEKTNDQVKPCEWQDESYDRIIRDAEHLYRVIQYIGRNPRLAGIERSHWKRWINPAWQKAGWDFEDS